MSLRSFKVLKFPELPLIFCAGATAGTAGESILDLEKLVEIEGLSKHFASISAVENVSFQVGNGEVLGFLGPNGAGKSTTMKMIAGYLTPDAGRVRVAGLDLAQDPVGVKRRIGYLPEGAPLYGDMTPSTFLDFIAAIRGFSGAEKADRIALAVRRTHLDSVLHQRAETLSKGFKRRVGLAQAILHDPPVLVLDEPTDGLDPNQKHEVRTLITEMARDKAIILSTHILEEVQAVCTRALIIARGRVVADGTPPELESRSRLHNAVTLEIGGPDSEDRHRILREVPGVDAVELEADGSAFARYCVYPNAGHRVLHDVSRIVREQGWDLRELHSERGRLDDVFRDITTGESAIS